MKTFDKFCEERQRHYLEHPELPTEASITELEYQQIKLDAAKAGMRLAAEACTNNASTACGECELKLKDVILAASDTLTLEELEKA